MDSDITHVLFILNQLINTNTTDSFIILRFVRTFNALAVQSIGCAKTEKRGETGPKGISGSGAVCVTTGAGRTKTSSHRPWKTACRPGNIIQRDNFISWENFGIQLNLDNHRQCFKKSLVISWSKVSGFQKYILITFFFALGTSQLTFVLIRSSIVSTQRFKVIGTRTTHFAVYWT